MSEITVSYHEGLLESLKDPEEATAYLNAALEDGDQEVFQLALQNVAEAHGIAIDSIQLVDGQWIGIQ